MRFTSIRVTCTAGKFLGETWSSRRNMFRCSLLRWKIIIPPILTTSLLHFPLKGWEIVVCDSQEHSRDMHSGIIPWRNLIFAEEQFTLWGLLPRKQKTPMSICFDLQLTKAKHIRWFVSNVCTQPRGSAERRALPVAISCRVQMWFAFHFSLLPWHFMPRVLRRSWVLILNKPNRRQMARSDSFSKNARSST